MDTAFTFFTTKKRRTRRKRNQNKQNSFLADSIFPRIVLRMKQTEMTNILVSVALCTWSALLIILSNFQQLNASLWLLLGQNMRVSQTAKWFLKDMLRLLKQKEVSQKSTSSSYWLASVKIFQYFNNWYNYAHVNWLKLALWNSSVDRKTHTH